MSESPSEPIAPKRLHLAFLDGIRGLAALEVLLFHIGRGVTSLIQFYGSQAHVDVDHLLRATILFNWLFNGYGHQSVVIFIVLSGYCLALPVAKDIKAGIKGGVKGFVYRRSRRILPTYFAALGLGLLLALIMPFSRQIGRMLNGDWAPSLSLGSLLSHILLLQNWTIWSSSIDPPMWSLAVEWQIYFVFALMLIPIWRRFGLTASAGLASLIGLVPIYVTRCYPGSINSVLDLSGSSLWMLGCFGIGMAAAAINFSSHERPHWPARVNWDTFFWATLGISAVLFFGGKLHALAFLQHTPTWVGDYVTAVWCASLLMCLSSKNIGYVQRLIRPVLETRIPMFIGSFSYSLYLTHMYILVVIALLFYRVLMTPLAHVAIFTGVVLPVSIVFAYLFHLLFERPFMSNPAPKTERQAEVAAIVNPAP